MGKQHDQLTLHEREQISVLKASGKSLREILPDRLGEVIPLPRAETKRYSGFQTKNLSSVKSSSHCFATENCCREKAAA